MQYQIEPVTPFQQNCSLIWCEETMRGALIDPGGESERLFAAAEKKGISIEKILVTHAHIDHAGAVGQISRERELPIEGPHKEDSFWIDMLPSQSAMFGFPTAETFEPTRWLEGGDTVQVGNVELNVLHCPGHTPGHVVFHHAETRVVFVGDVLFQGSIGRTDFPRGDFDTLVGSITKELWPLGDETRFVPGHGPESTFGDERATNPFVSDRALS